MKVCAVSFKECWRDSEGRWFSDGGFPLQMSAIGTLFDGMTLLIVESAPKAGGLPLPGSAEVVALPKPQGRDGRRKVWIAMNAGRYVRKFLPHLRSCDVLHAPLPGDLPLIAFLLAAAMRKRTIVRYGGSWRLSDTTTWMNRVTRGLMRFCAGGRHVMFAAGDEAAAPAGNVRWLFSTALSRQEVRNISPCLERGLSSPPRLITIGRLSPEKGVDQLIQALAMLRDPGSVAPQLTVAGDGPERDALVALAKSAGCAEQVRFAGQLDRKQLSAELLKSDVCVQASRSEGFSKAWLDAFAHGVPVLASRVGAASAVIGENERGWLMQRGDAAELAASLRTILNRQTGWYAMRRNCRAYAEARTLESWAEEIGRGAAAQWGLRLAEGKLTA